MYHSSSVDRQAAGLPADGCMSAIRRSVEIRAGAFSLVISAVVLVFHVPVFILLKNNCVSMVLCYATQPFCHGSPNHYPGRALRPSEHTAESHLGFKIVSLVILKNVIGRENGSSNHSLIRQGFRFHFGASHTSSRMLEADTVCATLLQVDPFAGAPDSDGFQPPLLGMA